MSASVAQVLAVDGSVAGAGFVVGEGIVVTCAHVVHAAGQGPEGRVDLVFLHVPGAPRVAGRVLPGQWRAPEAEDIAVVELEGGCGGRAGAGAGGGGGVPGPPGLLVRLPKPGAARRTLRLRHGR